MGKKFDEISKSQMKFIEDQKIFFTGTADRKGRVNISPKGMDSLRVLSPNRVIWLNATGSGNETAAHTQNMPRITIMFVAFEGKPVTMRLYGEAKAIHVNDPEWEELYALLPDNPGARQIFDCSIDLVQTSCGMSNPYYEYKGERDELNKWADKKGPEKIKQYWHEKNQHSIDGTKTHIEEKSS